MCAGAGAGEHAASCGLWLTGMCPMHHLSRKNHVFMYQGCFTRHKLMLHFTLPRGTAAAACPRVTDQQQWVHLQAHLTQSCAWNALMKLVSDAYCVLCHNVPYTRYQVLHQSTAACLATSQGFPQWLTAWFAILLGGAGYEPATW